MAEIQFPEGDFYACNDPETLTLETPEEALEEYFDGVASKDCDMVALIRQWSPVTVKAYRPKEIGDKEIERLADRLLDLLGDVWWDEYGNPEDDSPRDAFPDDAEKVMLDAVTKIIRGIRVWACESVGEVTLDANQAEALMRAYRPDWFEAPTPPSEGGAK